MKRYIPSLLAVLTIVIGVVYANLRQPATTRTIVSNLEVQFNPKTYASMSDLVAQGTFQKFIRTWNDVHGLSLDEWQFQVSDQWKGPKQSTFTVSIPSQRGEGVFVEDAVDLGLQPGTERLIYASFDPEQAKWYAGSTAQGVFSKSGTTYVNARGAHYGLVELRAGITAEDLSAVTPAKLTASSDLIVYGALTKGGTVVRTNAAGKNTPWTSWSIAPSAVWKGTAPANLALSIVGGVEPNGSWTPYEVQMDIRDGLSALMFLKKDAATNEWHLVSARHGFFVKTDGRFYDPHGIGYAEAELRAAVSS